MVEHSHPLRAGQAVTAGPESRRWFTGTRSATRIERQAMDKIKQHTAGIGGWTIDREADAAYLMLRSHDVAKTIAYDIINVDLDEQGRVVGVELLTLRPVTD